jgi:hypothetical protein
MTTYVLGAGASIHANYPLASKMGGELLEFMLNYKFADDRFRLSAENLIEIFGSTPNIEDLISEIEIRIDSLHDPKNDDDRIMRIILRDARTHVAQMLREWFRIIHTSPAPLYAQFADCIVKSGETVITFNYDDSLDRELKRASKWDLAHGYGFPLGSNVKSEVLLLKLHGSINWMLSIFGGLSSGFSQISSNQSLGQYPIIAEPDVSYLGYSEFSGRIFKGGAVSMGSLILPGRNKQFFVETSLGRELEGFWNTLWSKAAHAVSRADRLVICGYSMPKADTRARDLLFNHTRKETLITVLCANDSPHIAREFKDAGYKNVEILGHGFFEDLIDSLKEQDIA